MLNAVATSGVRDAYELRMADPDRLGLERLLCRCAWPTNVRSVDHCCRWQSNEKCLLWPNSAGHCARRQGPFPKAKLPITIWGMGARVGGRRSLDPPTDLPARDQHPRRGYAHRPGDRQHLAGQVLLKGASVSGRSCMVSVPVTGPEALDQTDNTIGRPTIAWRELRALASICLNWQTHLLVRAF
jgi:hypothetical protein